MKLKILAAAAGLTLLAAGAAQAQDYGRPPYGSSDYAYGGGSCGGFTIAGGYAGVTLLGIDFGVAGRARVNGDCGGYGGASYAPPPPPAYQSSAYPAPAYGGGYGPQVYASPVAYPQPSYGYAPPPQPSYGFAAAPCGCQAQSYGYAQSYAYAY